MNATATRLLFSLALVVCLSAASALQAANLALPINGGVANLSSTDFGGTADRANDGNRNGQYGAGSVSHSQFQFEPYLEVSLSGVQDIDVVSVYNRTDCCGERVTPFMLQVFSGLSEVYNSGSLAFTQNRAIQDGNNAAVGSGMLLDIPNTAGDRVRLTMLSTNYLNLAELEVYNVLPPGVHNVAATANGGVANMSSTAFGGDPGRAVDGNRNGDYFAGQSVAHSAGGFDFIETTLAHDYDVSGVAIFNRTDCCDDRITPFNLDVYDGASLVYSLSNVAFVADTVGPNVSGMTIPLPLLNADRVRITSLGGNFLNLAEFEVFGVVPVPEPATWTLAGLGLANLIVVARKRRV